MGRERKKMGDKKKRIGQQKQKKLKRSKLNKYESGIKPGRKSRRERRKEAG